MTDRFPCISIAAVSSSGRVHKTALPCGEDRFPFVNGMDQPIQISRQPRMVRNEKMIADESLTVKDKKFPAMPFIGRIQYLSNRHCRKHLFVHRCHQAQTIAGNPGGDPLSPKEDSIDFVKRSSSVRKPLLVQRKTRQFVFSVFTKSLAFFPPMVRSILRSCS